MSKESRYELTKRNERHELGISSRDKTINFHHIINRSDFAKHRVPKDFPLNEECNVIPLKIRVHELLHYIDDRYFHRDIRTRVYLANMAYNGDLQDVPDRIYFVDPMDIVRRR